MVIGVVCFADCVVHDRGIVLTHTNDCKGLRALDSDALCTGECCLDSNSHTVSHKSTLFLIVGYEIDQGSLQRSYLLLYMHLFIDIFLSRAE